VILKKNIPADLEFLICEGGFPDEKSLTSFALALGIFNDVEGDSGDMDGMISPETLPSYSLSALVLSDGGRKDISMDRMREMMLRRIAGGLDLIITKVRGKSSIPALKELASMIPSQ
jgi:hypothetical protein